MLNIVHRILLSVVVMAFVAFQSFAQAEIDIASPSESNNLSDSLYQSTFKRQLGLHAMTNMKFNRLRLHNKSNDNEIEYNPSENLKIGAGFFYQWLGLAFTYRLPQTDEHLKQKGRTESYDTQVNLFSKKFVFDGYFQKYKGYYLNNYKDYYPERELEIDGYPQRNDIKTTNIGVNFTWVFNHKRFSYRSAYLFNEFQKKSAGSFIAGAFFAGSYNSGDSVLVSEELQQQFGSIYGIERLNTRSFGLTFGYARTFVIKKHFFISFSIQAGPMINNSTLRSSQNLKDDSFEQFGAKYILRGSAGYNHEKFYVGVTGLEDSYSFTNNQLIYTYQLGSVKFFIGKRLNFNKSFTLFKKRIFK